ncbi:NAD(P)H-binding protein [Actinokineospora enzanensis]|uniref:NAD(P)H-binding protein n=1 Tax=Actinokineospora enzanensis TaxID=155975 RepID=UPI0003AB36C1|nr:NAD(P)H-binding protein [Actinokineospora enzanensis]
MRVLVTGATGTVGRHVVEGLVSAGVDVRALTRRPEQAGLPDGVDVVAGDLTQPDAALFAGIDRMYMFPAGDTRVVLDLARQAGVRRVVVLSSLSAADPSDWGGKRHRDVEVAAEESGLEWTHLRPGMFTANLSEWGESIRTEGVARAPYAALTLAPVHQRDIAEVAVQALLTDELVGRTLRLTGPEPLSRPEQAAAIGRGIGREVRFEELTPEQWRASLPDQFPAAVSDWLLNLWAGAVDTPEVPEPTVPDVLGKPARTVEEWAREHADLFR